MKTLKDFTPEIREKIDSYKKRCTIDLYRGVERENFDRKKADEYIATIYNIAKFEKPLTFYASDPTEYKVMYQNLQREEFIDELLIIFKDKNEGIDVLEREIEFSEKLKNAENFDPRIPAKTYFLNEISVYSRVYFMWYYFIMKEFGIKYSREELLTYLYENSLNGIMRSYFTKSYVLFLLAPEEIVRDADSLHNIHGPAIKYPKGSIYMIKGRKLPEKYFMAIQNKTLKSDDFYKEENEEIKSAMIAMMQELYGDEYIVHFLSDTIKEVDTYVDKKPEKYLDGTSKSMNVGVYTLFKGHINDEEVAYVRCFCPTTDRMFFLGVEPHHTNPKDAIASLYRIPKKLKNEIKYIQRQGERFTTILSEEGKELSKKLSKEELRDTTTISGDEYFGKMRYEY